MIYDGHMTKRRGQSDSVPLPHLLQITVHDGGMVTIDQERMATALLTGIEYKSLKAIMVGMHELMGSLIELATEAKLVDVPENPVMKGPKEVQ